MPANCLVLLYSDPVDFYYLNVSRPKLTLLFDDYWSLCWTYSLAPWIFRLTKFSLLEYTDLPSSLCDFVSMGVFLDMLSAESSTFTSSLTPVLLFFTLGKISRPFFFMKESLPNRVCAVYIEFFTRELSLMSGLIEGESGAPLAGMFFFALVIYILLL